MCTLSLIALVIGRMKEDGMGKWEKDVEFYLENRNAGEHLGKFGASVGEISKYKLDTNIRPGPICIFGTHLLPTLVQLPTVVNSFIIFMRMRSNEVEHCSKGGCWLWVGLVCYWQDPRTVLLLHADRKHITFRVASSEWLHRANAFRMINISFSVVTKFAHAYLSNS